MAAQPSAKIRVDANAAWDVDTAVTHIRQMDRAAGGLEYVEQPCPDVEDLARTRRRVDVQIAADESIRRARDPLEVARRHAADIAVVKNQPLGGVRAALELAERLRHARRRLLRPRKLGGLRAGPAFAAALPELPYACGLATSRLFRHRRRRRRSAYARVALSGFATPCSRPLASLAMSSPRRGKERLTAM